MTLATIRAAFMPLLDASILIAGREAGFAESEGLDLRLVRETSWANVRDRMAIGHFDAAHMLAPMPIAANLGLTPFAMNMIVPMALGLGGNAITVSTSLFSDAAFPLTPDKPGLAGEALKRLIEERSQSGLRKLRFGVVHPHSAHNFELRYWMAASGIAPDSDVEIVILPPPYMADALEQGDLDGFCVGEPWNTLAVTRGTGRIVTTKQAIWSNSPEKVLGLSEAWAGSHPEELARLLRALSRSAEWCGVESNRKDLAAILSSPSYLGLDAALLEASLAGEARFRSFEKAATFPWQSHALWFYSQMVRWGQVGHSAANAELGAIPYRPDIYRAIIGAAGGLVPGANAKVEGMLSAPDLAGASGGALVLGPDGFFDGLVFDPDKLDSYITAQSGLR